MGSPLMVVMAAFLRHGIPYNLMVVMSGIAMIRIKEFYSDATIKNTITIITIHVSTKYFQASCTHTHTHTS